MIYSGKLKVEDKKLFSSFGNQPNFKDRWGVLCPTRLLLLKEEPNLSNKQFALAIYPIINSYYKIIVHKDIIKIMISFKDLEN